MQEQNRKPVTEQERHGVVQYALLEQPRPGNRETRMRETAGAWMQRNRQGEETE